jgi:hypothetical protein
MNASVSKVLIKALPVAMLMTVVAIFFNLTAPSVRARLRYTEMQIIQDKNREACVQRATTDNVNHFPFDAAHGFSEREHMASIDMLVRTRCKIDNKDLPKKS